MRWTETPEGFLTSTVKIMHSGIWMNTNSTTGETRRELVTLDELFKQESLDNLKMKPVIYGHSEKIDLKDIKQYQVGAVTKNVGRSDDCIACQILVTDKDLINALKSKKINIEWIQSSHENDIINESGVWNEQPYDAIQKNITYCCVGLADLAR